MPAAIGGGVVAVAGIVVLVIVLMSGDNPFVGNDDVDFVASLPPASWGNEPLETLPPIDPELDGRLGFILVQNDLSAFLQALNGDNVRAKHEALDSLRFLTPQDASWESREDVIDPAIKCLDSDTQEVRIAAAEVLEVFGEDAAAALVPLAVMLRDGQSELERYTAAEALLALGEAARPAVPLFVATANEFRKEEDYLHFGMEPCVTALAELNCVDELMQMYQAGGNLSGVALKSMGRLRPIPPKILDLLLDAMEGESSHRSEAVAGLGFVRPTSPRIVKAMKKALLSDDYLLSSSAIVAVGEMDVTAPGFVELLALALQSDDFMAGLLTDILDDPRLPLESRVRIKLAVFAKNESHRTSDGKSPSSLFRELPKEGIDILAKIVEAPLDAETSLMRCLAAFVVADTAATWEEDGGFSNENLTLEDSTTYEAKARAWVADESLGLDIRASAAIGLSEVTSLEFQDLISDALVSAQESRVRYDALEWIRNCNSWKHDEVVPANEFLQPLMQALSQKEGRIAALSARALKAYGSNAQSAIPALWDALEIRTLENREYLVDAIGEIGDPSGKSIDKMLDFLLVNDGQDYSSALEALGKLAAGTPAKANEVLAVLTEELETGEWKESAAIALGFMGSLAAPTVPMLAQYAVDPPVDTKDVDEPSVIALGKIAAQPEVAVPALIQALDNEDIQYEATVALDAYGTHAAPALPRLIRLTDEYAQQWYDDRFLILCSLIAKFGDTNTEAVSKLRPIATNSDMGRDRRYYAGLALYVVNNGDPAVTADAVAAIFNYVDTYEWNSNAEEVRAALGDNLLEIVSIGLQHEDEQTRENAMRVAEAFELSAAAAVMMLEQIESGDAIAAISAIEMLAAENALRSIEPQLLSRLEAESAEVRTAAGNALASLGGYAPQVVPVLVEDYLDATLAGEEPDLPEGLYAYRQRAGLAFWHIIVDATAAEEKRAAAVKAMLDNYLEPPLSKQELKTALADEDINVRTVAAVFFVQSYGYQEEAKEDAKLTEQLVSLFLSGLDAPTHEELRIRCIQGLGSLGKSAVEARERLWAIWKEQEDSSYQAASALSFIGLGDAAWQEVIGMLQNDETRQQAISLITDFIYSTPVPEAHVGSLVEFFCQATLEDFDDDEYLRESFATVLAEANETGLQAMLSAVRDANQRDDVRSVAMDGVFEQLRYSEEALPAAVQQACQELLSSDLFSVRLGAVSLLFNTDKEDSAALDALTAAIDSPETWEDNEWTFTVLNLVTEKGNESLQASAAAALRRELQNREADEFSDWAYWLAALSQDPADAKFLLESATKLSERYEFDNVARGLTQHGEEIAQLMADALQDDRQEVRLLAAMTLGKLGEDAASVSSAVEARLQVLAEQAEPHRAELTAVAGALGRMKVESPLAVELLVSLLNHSEGDQEIEYDEVSSILEALASFGEQAAPAAETVAKFLRDDQPTYEASYALQAMGPAAEPAVPQLIEMLDGGYFDSAAETLRSIGEPARAATPRLLSFLSDDVRADSAARALAAIADPEIRQAAVTKLMANFDDHILEAGAVGSLGHFGADAEPAFEQLLDRINDDRYEVARSAMDAVGELHEHLPQGVEPLVAALDREDVQYSALNALERYGPQAAPAVPKIIELLNSTEDYWIYTETLRAIGPAAAEAIPTLERIKQQWHTKDEGYAKMIDEAIAVIRGELPTTIISR